MSQSIRLRNVRVHNLQSVDLDLPKRKLLAFCGPSGSGKSSLAVDTLLAEGQRRYLDTFSIASKGLIDQPEKPAADEIDSVPPAISISRSNQVLSSRLTVGNLAELEYFLQIAFAQHGQVVCAECDKEVGHFAPDNITDLLMTHRKAGGTEPLAMVGFVWSRGQTDTANLEDLLAHGFLRAVHQQQVLRIADLIRQDSLDPAAELMILVDRVRMSENYRSRLRESVETAFHMGQGACFAMVQEDSSTGARLIVQIDGQPWSLRNFSAELVCHDCGVEYQRLSANELSSNSPVGACSECEGLGWTQRFSPEKLGLDCEQSIASSTSGILLEQGLKSFEQKLKTVMGEDFEKPLKEIRGAGSLDSSNPILAILDGLYLKETKQAVKKKLEPFRTQEVCSSCHGLKLNRNALSYRLGGKNLGQLLQISIARLEQWIQDDSVWTTPEIRQYIGTELLSRLEYLRKVGLGYLTLGRQVQTLSTGERQRVAMTNALGSQLVNMLYILDEPCAGLHPTDLPSLISSLRALVDQGNTVVAVDHELDLIRQVDQVTEFGPGSGSDGGRIVYCGPPAGLQSHESSPTGQYLSGVRKLIVNSRPVGKELGRIRLSEATGNNLQGFDVEFPLGQLCVVAGVSGSGKSSLVVDTLFPAINNRLKKKLNSGLPFGSISGCEKLDDVVLVDQSPLTTTARSNPVTYCKIFDAIRGVFADTVDARARNFKAGKFSFNTEGGRCDACQGEGTKPIDMKFMANLNVKCKFCNGLRYKQEILNCRYRNRNIAQVLEMTVREAFTFFRGQKKVQSGLKPLIDVGLGYLQLGQPASTLSSGEAQRLRLAGFLTSSKKARTLFVLDEPTIGLHFCDVEKLLDCFGALLAEGHSIILVEHNRMVMSAADYLVDLGPGAGELGGRIISCGTPAEVAKCPESKTGAVLREIL